MFSAIPPDWIVLAAGLTFMLGYAIINQVILRWLIMLGTFFYIWYYAVALADPWAAILTSVLMGLANLFGLAQIYYRNSKWIIPEQHKDLYERLGSLPPGDFKALTATCKRYVLETNRIATKEGEPVEKLFYLVKGQISASKLGKEFDLPAGIFVGEVAYLAKQNASATTIIYSGAEVLEWDAADLVQRSAKSDRFRLALEALISKDLAAKVAKAVTVDTRELSA